MVGPGCLFPHITPPSFPEQSSRPFLLSLTPTKQTSSYTQYIHERKRNIADNHLKFESNLLRYAQATIWTKSPMGNCLFGGMAESDGVIKVVTSNGGIMEFYAPVTVGFITKEFPEHGVFRSRDLFWKPLHHNHKLVAGQSYYLLPLNNNCSNLDGAKDGRFVRHGHVRSNSLPAASVPAPYRMSLDYQYQQGLLRRSYTEAFSSSKSGNCGGNSNTSSGRFWKVKLVISPEQLLDILSQEARTKELIENVRVVAKCGGGGGDDYISSEEAEIISDEWSLKTGNRSASSDNTVAVDI